MISSAPLSNARALAPVAASISGTEVADATPDTPIVNRTNPASFRTILFVISKCPPWNRTLSIDSAGNHDWLKHWRLVRTADYRKYEALIPGSQEAGLLGRVLEVLLPRTGIPSACAGCAGGDKITPLREHEDLPDFDYPGCRLACPSGATKYWSCFLRPHPARAG